MRPDCVNGVNLIFDRLSSKTCGYCVRLACSPSLKFMWLHVSYSGRRTGLKLNLYVGLIEGAHLFLRPLRLALFSVQHFCSAARLSLCNLVLGRNTRFRCLHFGRQFDHFVHGDIDLSNATLLCRLHRFISHSDCMLCSF